MEKKAEKVRMLISKTGRCSTGLTLLELIIVIFIVSIVMAVIVPLFPDLEENKSKSEAREIASILRYLYDSAITRKETFFIKFNFNEDSIYIRGPDGEKVKKFKNIQSVSTQSRGSISKGEFIFFFEPLGIRENITVHLDGKNKDLEIILNHLSGRVKIKDGRQGKDGEGIKI